MSPAVFCKCGAGVCGHICCKTEQDPKKCDGIWRGNKDCMRFLKRGYSEID